MLVNWWAQSYTAFTIIVKVRHKRQIWVFTSVFKSVANRLCNKKQHPWAYFNKETERWAQSYTVMNVFTTNARLVESLGCKRTSRPKAPALSSTRTTQTERTGSSRSGCATSTRPRTGWRRPRTRRWRPCSLTASSRRAAASWPTFYSFAARTASTSMCSPMWAASPTRSSGSASADQT